MFPSYISNLFSLEKGNYTFMVPLHEGYHEAHYLRIEPRNFYFFVRLLVKRREDLLLYF